MIRTAVAVLLGGALLGACSSPAPELTPAQRDDAFWTAYEQRTGMVGKDYADPARAKTASISYGRTLCDELAKGTDPRIITKGSSTYSSDEVQVHLETAVEFLCPDQAARIKS